MEDQFFHDSREEDLPTVPGHPFGNRMAGQGNRMGDSVGQPISHRFRRGRRHTPPGLLSPRARLRGRYRSPSDWKSVQIGDVIADLTPRQAVVWLLNFDTMVSLYESTTGSALDADARGRLVQSLRTIVAERRR